MPICVFVIAPFASFATPRSPSLTISPDMRSTLAVFTSRCKIFCACSACKPRAIWMK